jgi:hypothetical protein
MTMINDARLIRAMVDDADKKSRAITFRLNTDDIDDHGTVIEPRGVRQGYYDAIGRPMLWHHGLDVRRGVDPVGKNEWVTPQGNKRPVLLSRNHFFKDDFSQQRYEWYQNGTLRGISLRFRQPADGDYGPPTPDEIRARPELERLTAVWRESQGKRGWMLRKWDLAEQSLTPLPSNPNTLSIPEMRSIMECCRSGMWLPTDVKAVLERRTTGLTGEGTRAMSTKTLTPYEERWARHERDMEFQQRTQALCQDIVKRIKYHAKPDYWEPMPGTDLRCQVFSRSGNLLGMVANASIASRIIDQARKV